MYVSPCARHYLWLIIVFNAHRKDIDADDEGDEEVQVVAGAQCVDGETQRRVVRIVRPLLGLWSTQRATRNTQERVKNIKQEQRAAVSDRSEL